MGNRRNIHAENKPHQFGTGVCSRVETIRMYFDLAEDWQTDSVNRKRYYLKTDDELNAFAVNDGFENWSQMKLWFDNEDKYVCRKIIFGKDCRWSGKVADNGKVLLSVYGIDSTKFN